MALPRYVSRAQKLTRDKEYRLRQKLIRAGATPEQAASAVRAVSPRRSAEDVAGMSAAEQRAYVLSLNNFRSRGNAYTPTSSGELIRTSTLRNMEALRRTYNRMAAERERRIDRLTQGTMVRERFGTVSEARQRRQGNITLNGRRVGGTLALGRTAQLEPMELPRDQIAAERRVSMLEDMTRASADMDRRNLVRATVEQMLLLQGDVETADRVGGLSDDEFDVLTTVTNFMDLLTTKFDSNDYAPDRLAMTNAELRDELGLEATGVDNSALMDTIGFLEQSL